MKPRRVTLARTTPIGRSRGQSQWHLQQHSKLGASNCINGSQTTRVASVLYEGFDYQQAIDLYQEGLSNSSSLTGQLAEKVSNLQCPLFYPGDEEDIAEDFAEVENDMLSGFDLPELSDDELCQDGQQDVIELQKQADTGAAGEDLSWLLQ